jgi:cytochrome oxidase Cu insertion factor (SCO1/SenC/PrrC family)
LALLAGAAAASPSEPAAHQLPAEPPARFEAPAPGSYQLPPIDRVGQHQLLGTRGVLEPLLALKPGELALISFVYLNCGESCPLATAMLHRLDGELAKDAALAKHVELVTVSFDPLRDTPAQMRALRERLAPKGRWRFLTAANDDALRPVLADFGQDSVWIPGGANAPDSLRHVLKVFVVDPSGAVRQIYSTGFLDVRLVLADLRTLLPAAR